MVSIVRPGGFLDRFGAVLSTSGDAVGVVVVELTVARGGAPDAEETQRLAGTIGVDGPVVALDARRLAAVVTDGGERAATKLAERLLAALAGSGRRASAGVAVEVGPGVQPQELLETAQLAAQHAREPGAVVVFEPAMRRRLADRRALAQDLRDVVAAKALDLAYQPIVSLADGAVIAAEALLRWTHPVRGAVPTSEFLALAADEGLTEPIGHWVLEAALGQLARWDADGDVQLAYLTINVFAHQLADPRFAREVAERLETAGVAPSRLAIESTEAAVSDSPGASATVEQLRALGVRLMLDDFGTGASSLRSLRRLPLSGVKIDRSFVAGLDEHTDDRHITAAVIGMARALGIDVIAEGVETAEQARWLRQLGCAVAQGFLFARPGLPDRIRPVLASGLGAATPAAAFGPVDEPGGTLPSARPGVRDDELITLGEAARLLGCSTSTTRRWADGGQLRTIRTAGGHRRFSRADVERLAGAGVASRPPVIQRPAFPSASPGVADALADAGVELAVAAGRSVYTAEAPGWLAGDAARPALERFTLELSSAARAGAEAVAEAAVRRLLDEARSAGAALVEVDAFVGRYFGLAARAVRRRDADDASLPALRTLATVARHVLLTHAEGR